MSSLKKAVASPANEGQKKSEVSAVAVLGPVLRTETRQDGALIEFRSCPGCGKEHRGLAVWFATKAGQAVEEKGYSEPFLCNRCAQARRKAAGTPVAGEKAEVPAVVQATAPVAKVSEKRETPKVLSIDELLSLADGAINEGAKGDEETSLFQSQWLEKEGVLSRADKARKELESAGDSLKAILHGLEEAAEARRKDEAKVVLLRRKLDAVRRSTSGSPELQKQLAVGIAAEEKRIQDVEAAASERRSKAVGRFFWAVDHAMDVHKSLGTSLKGDLYPEMSAHLQETRKGIQQVLSSRVREAREAGVTFPRRLEVNVLAVVTADPRVAAHAAKPARPQVKKTDAPVAKAENSVVATEVKDFLTRQTEEMALRPAASLSGVMTAAFASAGITLPVQSEEGKAAPAVDPSEGEELVAEAPKAEATSPKAEAKPRKAAKPKASSKTEAQAEVKEETKKTRRGSRGK